MPTDTVRVQFVSSSNWEKNVSIFLLIITTGSNETGPDYNNQDFSSNLIASRKLINSDIT